MTTSRYDGAGRLVFQASPDYRVRSWAYATSLLGERVEHVYAGPSPDGVALTTTTWHRDGRIKSIGGSAETPRSWSYSASAAYRETTYQYISGHLAEAVTVDGFGRTFSVQAPVSINSSGSALSFTSNYHYDENGSLVARSRRSPNGNTVWEVARSTWSEDGLTMETGISADTTWASATMDVRKSLTQNTIDLAIPNLNVEFFDPAVQANGSESVAFGWRTVSECLPTSATDWTATSETAWEATAARISKTPLSARRVAAWPGHTANAIPLGHLNDGGNVVTRAVARNSPTGLIDSVLTTETRTLRSGFQYRKVDTRNGLDVALTSPDASNVAMPHTPAREPLADFSWDTIPHWPKREIDAATGLITARLLPNSSVYTEKYAYFTSPTDHRAGRIKSSTTWTTLTNPPEKGVTYYHYNPHGQILASYGSGSPTTLYKYDGAGRMTQLRTYRSAPRPAAA